MKNIRLAREKLVEKNIDWKEAYTDKTLFLKKQFEDVVGPGSYFRFEGKAMDGSEYYCILGPAKIHDPIAKFFAGVRKLPATYSAGGKYFDSLDTAAEYARVTWGIPRSRELRAYNATHLVGIGQRVEQWKQMHDAQDMDTDSEGGESMANTPNDKVSKPQGRGGNKRVKKNKTFTRQVEAASGPWWQGRPNMEWWDYDEIASSAPPQELLELSKIDSSITILINDARLCRGKKIKQIVEKYGLSFGEAERVQKTYIGYHPNYGGYICQVGPYVGAFERGNYQFGYFFLRRGAADEDTMKKAVARNVAGWREKYGIEIGPEDISFTLKSQTKPFDYERKRQPAYEALLKLDNVADDNPEYQDFLQQESLVGIGSSFDLNPKGLSRLIHTLGDRDGWLGLFQESVAEIAAKKQLSPEEMLNSKKFLEAAYRGMLKKFSQIEDNPEALANQGISKPPPLKLKMSAQAGGQTETALRTNNMQIRELNLIQEVLQTLISGEEDPNKILAILNNSAKRMETRKRYDEDTGKWIRTKPSMKISELSRILKLIDESRYIKDETGNVTSQKSYLELYEDGEDILSGITPDENGVPYFAGFKELAIAFEQLRMYVTTTRIDPTTRAKVDYDPQMSSFNPSENFVNYTSDHLRAGTLDDLEDTEDVEDAEDAEDVEEDFPIEVEPEEDFTDEDTTVIDPVSVPVEHGDHGESVNETPILDNPSTDNEEITEKSQIKPLHHVRKHKKDNVISHIIHTLIKIAEMKDKEGNSQHAEEIHKLMRKFLEGN